MSHNGFPFGMRLEATVAVPAPVSGHETDDPSEQDSAAINDNFPSTCQSHDRLLIELVLLIGAQDDGCDSDDRDSGVLSDSHVGFDEPIDEVVHGAASPQQVAGGDAEVDRRFLPDVFDERVVLLSDAVEAVALRFRVIGFLRVNDRDRWCSGVCYGRSDSGADCERSRGDDGRDFSHDVSFRIVESPGVSESVRDGGHLAGRIDPGARPDTKAIGGSSPSVGSH